MMKSQEFSVRESAHYRRVMAFMIGFEQRIRARPTVPPLEERILRVRLIAEELGELAGAMGLTVTLDTSPMLLGDEMFLAVAGTDHEGWEPRLVDVADALADLDYVVTGSFLACGIPQEVLSEEVHRSNMSKLGEDGRPIKNEHGKVVKSPRYSPPRIRELIDYLLRFL